MKITTYIGLLVAAICLMGATGVSAQTVKIGVAGPFTGGNAQFGEQMKEGALLAAKHINAKGGIGGRKVELVFGDDQCDAKQARSVANDLSNQKVYAVVGHFCSSSTIPASEVYDENNILQITPASTNPKVTDRGLAAIFRTCGRDDQQGSVAANYIAKELNASRIAVIHDKDTYGQGLADAMRSELNKVHSKKEILYEGITRGDKDFNSLVTKMKGLNVDVIYFGGLFAEAGLLARQAAEQGLKAKFFSGDGIVSDVFADIAGPAAEGVLMTFGADARGMDEAKAVVAEFRKNGYEPEAYTLYSYATVQIIAAALENNLTRKGDVLAKYLKSKTFSTVMGPKSFDAKGDLKVTDYVVYQWHKTKKGKLTYKEL